MFVKNKFETVYKEATRLFHHYVSRFNVFFQGFMPQRLGFWLVKLIPGVTQHPAILSATLICIYFNTRSLCNKLASLNALLRDCFYNTVFDLKFVTVTRFNDEKITDGLILNDSNYTYYFKNG